MNSVYNWRQGKMRQVGVLLAALLLAMGVLAGCGSSSSKAGELGAPKEGAEGTTAAPTAAKADDQAGDQAYPLTVQDEMGHEVTIPANPDKVFAPMMEDSLLALGVKPVMQWSNGVQPQLYLKDQLEGVPEIGFASGQPSFEVLLANKPDLIILHNSFYAENGAYEQYSKIAPTYVFKSASNDLASSIRIVGKLLNKTDEAEKVLKEYEAKAEAAKTKLAGHAKGRKAAIIRFNAKGMFFMNYDYYSGYVLAKNLGFGQSDMVKSGAYEVSLEKLPELDADYIFLINDGNLGDAALKTLKESKIWQSVPGVKKGQVYETASDYWLSGGFIAQGKVIDDIVRFLAP